MKRLLVLIAVTTLLTSTTGCWRSQAWWRGGPCGANAYPAAPFAATYYAPTAVGDCCESGCCESGYAGGGCCESGNCGAGCCEGGTPFYGGASMIQGAPLIQQGVTVPATPAPPSAPPAVMPGPIPGTAG